jgi:hypothetical protein
MSEFERPSAASGTEPINFRVVASGSLDPTIALDFQQRIIEVLSGMDTLRFSLEISNDELPELTRTGERAEALSPAAQEWLDTDVESLLENSGASSHTKNCLSRNSLTSRRHLLLYGRQRLSDLRGFGVKSMSEVLDIVENNAFGIELLDKPGLDYAVTICKDASQVPGCIYMRTGWDTTTSLAGLAAMSPQEIVKRYIYTRPERKLDNGRWIEEPHSREERKAYRMKAEAFKERAMKLVSEFNRQKTS